MHTSKRFKMLLAGLSAAAILTASVPAYAAQAEKTVQVTYQNIRVSVNGRVAALQDSDGNSIEPFNYNGTVYLPVRGVSQALGLTVDFDSASNTVLLTGTVDSGSQTADTPPAGTGTDGQQQNGTPPSPPSGDGQTGTPPSPPTGDGQTGTPPSPPTGDGQTGTPPSLPAGDGQTGTPPTAPTGTGQTGTPPSGTKGENGQAATAEAVVKSVGIVFKDIQVSLNGQVLALADSDGNAVEPFIYGGSTYLPVRAISEALGLTVSYDDTIKMVKVGNDSLQGPGGRGGPGGAKQDGTASGSTTGSAG